MNPFFIRVAESVLPRQYASRSTKYEYINYFDFLEDAEGLFHLEVNSKAYQIGIQIDKSSFLKKINSEKSVEEVKRLELSSQGASKDPITIAPDALVSCIKYMGIFPTETDIEPLDDFFATLKKLQYGFQETFHQLLNKSDGDPSKALMYCAHILFVLENNFPADFDAGKECIVQSLQKHPIFSKICENKELESEFKFLFNSTVPRQIFNDFILINSLLQSCRRSFINFSPNVTSQIFFNSNERKLLVKFNESQVILRPDMDILTALISIENYLDKGSIPKEAVESFEMASQFFFPLISSFNIVTTQKYTREEKELAEKILTFADVFLSNQATRILGFLLTCHCGAASETRGPLTELLKILPELLTSSLSIDTKKTLLLAFANYYHSVLLEGASKAEKELLELYQCIENSNDKFEILEKLCSYLIALEEKFVFEEVLSIFNEISKLATVQNYTSIFILGTQLTQKCISLEWKYEAVKIFTPCFAIMQRFGAHVASPDTFVKFSESMASIFPAKGGKKAFSSSEKFVLQKIFYLLAPGIKDPSIGGLIFLIQCNLASINQETDLLSELMRMLPHLMVSNSPPKMKAAFLNTFYQQIVTMHPNDTLKDQKKMLDELCRLLVSSESNRLEVVEGLCKFFSISNEKWILSNIFSLFSKARELTQLSQGKNDGNRALGLRLITRCSSVGLLEAATEIFKILRSSPKITATDLVPTFNSIVAASVDPEGVIPVASKGHALNLYDDCEYLLNKISFNPPIFPVFVPIVQSLIAHKELDKALSLLTAASAKKAPEAQGSSGAQLRLSIANEFFKTGHFSKAFNLWKESTGSMDEGLKILSEWMPYLLDNTFSKEETWKLLNNVLIESKGASGKASDDYLDIFEKLLLKELYAGRSTIFELVEFLQPHAPWLLTKYKVDFSLSSNNTATAAALGLLQQSGTLSISQEEIEWLVSEEAVQNWVSAFLACLSLLKNNKSALTKDQMLTALRAIASKFIDSDDQNEKSIGYSLFCSCHKEKVQEGDFILAISALPSVFCEESNYRMIAWEQFLADFKTNLSILFLAETPKLSNLLMKENTSSKQMKEAFCRTFSLLDGKNILEKVISIWKELESPSGLGIEIALHFLFTHFETSKEMLSVILLQKNFYTNASEAGISEALAIVKAAPPERIQEKELRILFDLLMHVLRNKKTAFSPQMVESISWLINALIKFKLPSDKTTQPLLLEGLSLCELADKNQVFESHPALAVNVKNNLCMQHYQNDQVKRLHPFFKQLLESPHADTVVGLLKGFWAVPELVSSELFELTLFACQKTFATDIFESLLQCLINNFSLVKKVPALSTKVQDHIEKILTNFKASQNYTLFYSFFKEVAALSICVLPAIEKHQLYSLILSGLQQNPSHSILATIQSNLLIFKNASTLSNEGACFYFQLAETYFGTKPNLSISCLETVLNSKMETLKEERHCQFIEKVFLEFVKPNEPQNDLERPIQESMTEKKPQEVLDLLQKFHKHFKELFPSKLLSLWIKFLRKHDDEKVPSPFVLKILVDNASWFNQQNDDEIVQFATDNAFKFSETKPEATVQLSELYPLLPIFWAYFFHKSHDESLFQRGFNAFTKNPKNSELLRGPHSNGPEKQRIQLRNRLIGQAWHLALKNCPVNLHGFFPFIESNYLSILNCVQIMMDKEMEVEAYRHLLDHIFKLAKAPSLPEVFNRRMQIIKTLRTNKILNKDISLQNQCISSYLEINHPKALEVACILIKRRYLSSNVTSIEWTLSINRAFTTCFTLLEKEQKKVFDALNTIIISHLNLFPLPKRPIKESLDLCSVLKFYRLRFSYSDKCLGDFSVVLTHLLGKLRDEKDYFTHEEKIQIKETVKVIFELTPTEHSLVVCNNFMRHPAYNLLCDNNDAAFYNRAMIVKHFKVYESLPEEEQTLKRIMKAFNSCENYIKVLGKVDGVKKEVLEILIKHMLFVFTKHGSWKKFLELFKTVLGHIGASSGKKIANQWNETLKITDDAVGETLVSLEQYPSMLDEVQDIRGFMQEYDLEFDTENIAFESEQLYKNFIEVFIEKCTPDENTLAEDYPFLIANCYFLLSQNAQILDPRVMIILLYKFILHRYPEEKHVLGKLSTPALIIKLKDDLIFDDSKSIREGLPGAYALELLSLAVCACKSKDSNIVFTDKHYIRVIGDLCWHQNALDLNPAISLLSYILAYTDDINTFIQTAPIVLKALPDHSKYAAGDVIRVNTFDEGESDHVGVELTILQFLGKIFVSSLDHKSDTIRSRKLFTIILDYFKTSMGIIFEVYPNNVLLNTNENWEKTFNFYSGILEILSNDYRAHEHTTILLDMLMTLIPLGPKVEEKVGKKLMRLLAAISTNVSKQNLASVNDLTAAIEKFNLMGRQSAQQKK